MFVRLGLYSLCQAQFFAKRTDILSILRLQFTILEVKYMHVLQNVF